MILLGHQFWLVDPLAGIGISARGLFETLKPKKHLRTM